MLKNSKHSFSGRRLAAILFTDIEGYTAMMQRDEKLAIAVVKRHQEVLEKTSLLYEGEVLQYYGDGSLSIFTSATAALRCAMDMQQEFSTYSPTKPVVPLRIGIHIGEILLEDGEVYGNGVNIASRIESAGHAGTVLFSRHVYDKIRNNPDFESTSLGFLQFKNVDIPMEIFALSNEGFPIPKQAALPIYAEKSPSFRDKKVISSTWAIFFGVVALLSIASVVYNNVQNSKISDYIAVLPLENNNRNPEQDYLSMGITEEIISELIKVKALRVKSFLSTKAYNHTDKSIREISSELQAPLILKGGIWSIGDSIRFNYKLIEAQNEESIVENDLSLHSSKIMTLSSKIVEQIVDAVGIRMHSEEKKHIEQITLPHPEAFDLYLKARAKHLLGMKDQSLQSLYESNDLLNRAIGIDPEFAKPYSLLAWNYQTLSFTTTGGMDPKEGEKLAYPLIKKSVELDPNSSDTYLIEGSINYFLRWDFEEANKSFEKALGLWNWYNRPTPYCFCGLTSFLIVNRRFEEAVTLIDDIQSIDPAYVYADADMGRIYFLTNHLDEAVRSVKKTMDISPILYWYELLGRIYIQKGEFQTAIDSMENGLAKYPHVRPALILGGLAMAYRKSAQTKKAEVVLEELNNRMIKGNKDIHYTLAFLEAGKGNYEHALSLLEEAYKNRDPNFIFINTEPYFEPLYEYPRFQALIEKMKFQFTALPELKD